GKRRWLERAFRLRQIDQVLRHALFAQDSRDLTAVFPRPAESGLHIRSPRRRWEKVQNENTSSFTRNRRAGGNLLGRFPAAAFQPRVDGKGHVGDFVDRRRYGRRLLETVTGVESLQFVGVDGINDLPEQFVQLCIAVEVVAAQKQQVHGGVEIAPRRFEVPGFEVLLAGGEFLLHFG